MSVFAILLIGVIVHASLLFPNIEVEGFTSDALRMSVSKASLNKQLVQVGQTKLSPIGCGTWSWGNRFLWQYSLQDDITLKKTYDYVIRNGVNWFDTADSYGTGDITGRSEVLLGKFSKDMSNSKISVNFCTKLAPYPWRIGSNSFLEANKESNARLQRSVDIVQLHWPPYLGWQENSYLDAFVTMLSQGTAKQIGVSNYGPKSLTKVCKYIESRGQRIYSNQVQFSLLSRYPIENDFLETCKELGIQPIGYSPLGLGLLADKYTLDRLPKGPRGILFREYLPSISPLLGELRSIAKYRKKTVSQIALNWVLQKGFLVLVGMRSIDQATDNLGALGWALNSAEVEVIDRTASKVRKQLIQNSFQND